MTPMAICKSKVCRMREYCYRHTAQPNNIPPTVHPYVDGSEKHVYGQCEGFCVNGEYIRREKFLKEEI